jgi:hypothetical protein
VRVRIEDFEDGVLPSVCVSTGARPDRLYRIGFSRTPVWSVFVALFLFPIGLLGIPLARSRTTGYLPFTDEVQERMHRARRTQLTRAGALATVTLLTAAYDEQLERQRSERRMRSS